MLGAALSSKRGLKAGEVADNNDDAVELEKVDKYFGDHFEEDPGYTNEHVINSDDDGY